MMLSLVKEAAQPPLGLIMTGMGKDGLNGLRAIKNAGGTILAQDEGSCVVYGMPRAAVEDGIVDAVVSLEDLPGMLVGVAKRSVAGILATQGVA
jgi:two-component system chemotaxis response regulator CheB